MLRKKRIIRGCAEIAIKSIPGIPTYVELECKNDKKIKKIDKELINILVKKR